ncbi:26S proteasome non-ATPase regulatory subunit 8-like [Diaphorina citri]|uniref:26S proteasome non-ATPase regulatory subunit 8 n=1 Tax=Diaphorina citri TaxID=121845 RepID=A0A3Q0JBN8_DIACI|nr:26S proteasome non-ATPase regulatory subunit 8-like [Diaphorina citri]
MATGDIQKNTQALKQELDKPKPDLVKCKTLLDQLKVRNPRIQNNTVLPEAVHFWEQALMVRKTEKVIRLNRVHQNRTRQSQVIAELTFKFLWQKQNCRVKILTSFSFGQKLLKIMLQYTFLIISVSSLSFSRVPESPYKNEMLGLNLLYLLSQNRVAEFHMELERIQYEDMVNDVYINHSLQLEQYLMEGNYRKIFLAKDGVPSPRYNAFMETLIDTTRNEIASCIEKAYTVISVGDTAQKLHIGSEKQMVEFGKKVKNIVYFYIFYIN